MSYLVRLTLALCGFIWLFSEANAQHQLPVDRENITVCPAFETDTSPPSPDRDGCQTMTAFEVDPQDNHIWVILETSLNEIPDSEPYGLFLSAKASSIAFLNGAEIGRNGLPADSKLGEITGRMDHVFPLPVHHMTLGRNEIAIRMSSHSGTLNLVAPIHALYITRYQHPQNATLRAYWPSLLPFGAFALGALYFLTIVALGRERLTSSFLAIMCLLAATQLLAEVSRGLFAYSYPFQDLRLLLIAACSAGFGLVLAVYVIWRFRPERKWALVALTAGATVAMLILPAGFDAKTSYSLLAPTIVAAAVAASAIKTDRVGAALFTVALVLFALVNFLGAGRFLDLYFYFIVSLLLVFLFVQQAGLLAKEERLRRREQSRAEKLQYVLDQINEHEVTLDLPIKSAGRIVRLDSSEIAFISAAGDYAEVTMKSGQTHLHHATLADLEAMLPSHFLRVHRSYLVNSKMIARLERHASGTGELSLTNERVVPVSRRIMPRIRAALS